MKNEEIDEGEYLMCFLWSGSFRALILKGKNSDNDDLAGHATVVYVNPFVRSSTKYVFRMVHFIGR